MNVTGRTRIYRKDYDGRPVYSRSIASRAYENGQQTDKWIRTYEDVRMPRGTELNDNTYIEVTKGFETVYAGRNGEVRRRLVVQEYRIVEEGESSGYRNNAAPAPSQSAPQQSYDEESFAGFGPILDEDIPF